jgi:hypothetical protein
MATQGEIVRAVLSYSHAAGSIAQNVFTWELQDEDSADAELLDGIDTWVNDEWGPRWDDIADSNAGLYLLEVDILNADGTVKRNIGEELQTETGGKVGDAMPAAVSGFFQMNTTRAKSYGRKYVPFMSEEENEEGFLSAFALGVLVLLLTATGSDIDVGIIGILAPGILSRVLEEFIPFTGGGYATDVPAYQRRRKPNVGS